MSAHKELEGIDRWFRAYLRMVIMRPGITQKMIAARIGRSQGWLNKYINGAGNATMDDLLRLVYVLCHLLPYEDLISPAVALLQVNIPDVATVVMTGQKGA